jgi:glutamate--cysteine ligase
VVRGYLDPVTQRIKNREQAEGYLALVCFKHGPPVHHGLELEWTVHRESDPRRPLDPDLLWQALGPHAPPNVTPESAHLTLPAGSRITVEPGGQLEISTLPHTSVAALISAARADTAHLRSIISDRGFVLGQQGTDPLRPPRRLLHTRRYDALEVAFDRVGPLGRQMMNSTASLQICVDSGEPHELAQRWHAVHALGPPLVALFANSPYLSGARTGWASSRLRAVLGMSPASTTPPDDTRDPVAHWVRLALEVPLVVIRRPQGAWTPPAGMTFSDWISAGSGDHGPAPTYDDLDYHLTTLFPVVRPRGYLEVRYLDQQPGDGWVAPLALLAALLSTPTTIDLALAAAVPAVGCWVAAARDGLTNPVLRRTAADVVDVGLRAMSHLHLRPHDLAGVTDRLQTLLDRAVTDRALAGRSS